VPVAFLPPPPVNAAAPGFGIAIELARQTIAHCGATRGTSAGIGPGSGRAVVLRFRAASPRAPPAAPWTATPVAPWKGTPR
jgi:hypothetical protein